MVFIFLTLKQRFQYHKRIDSNNRHLNNVQVYKTHALKKNSFDLHKTEDYLFCLIDEKIEAGL